MSMRNRLRLAAGVAVAVATVALSSFTTASAAPAPAVAHAAAASIPTGLQSFSTTYSPSSYCLNAEGQHNQADLKTCGWTSTQWYITQVSSIDSNGGAWVTLKDRYYNLCLDAENDAGGSPNTDGDHAQSWPCNGDSEQMWYLWPLAGGHWQIISHANTNMVLDARTDNTFNPTVFGDPVQLWYHHGTVEQTWNIFP